MSKKKIEEKNRRCIDKETGEVVWKSRSVAVAAFIVASDPETGEYNFLVERRGEGCPNHVGELSCPCGYLDYGETRKDAIIREVREELGLEMNPDLVFEWMTDDNPEHDEHQNIVTRYLYVLPMSELKDYLEHKPDLNSEERGGEKGEVSEILSIPYSKINNPEYVWAFRHNEILDELVSCVNEIANGL